jgi:hypothetical protein
MRSRVSVLLTFRIVCISLVAAGYKMEEEHECNCPCGSGVLDLRDSPYTYYYSS